MTIKYPKISNNIKIIQASVLVLAMVVYPIILSTSANAASIMGRKIALSSSVGDASNVTYTFTTSVVLPTATPIKSLDIKICTLLTDSCASTPAGFSSASSTLAAQPSGLGAASGWTVDTLDSDALRIVNAANSTNPSGNVSIVWNGVHNPTLNNSTFYGIITTYSGSDFTGQIDTGSVALSTSSQIQVAFTVGETLIFCTGTSITAENCGTVSGSLVNLGNGSTTGTSTGTSVIAASTNGATGYSISVNGNTLTSGANTITALTTGDTSSIGERQFGINLADDNATPPVGADKTGNGTGAAELTYGTDDTFRFASGETIAAASGPTNANTFTVSYIANIDGLTPAGVYTTNLNYIATANF